jgi:2-C-methyl-D-erythritol 4-phosphate cytidylyltransferase
LIPAAGVGARMGAGSPKQYLKIGGKPMLRHTIDAFLSSELIAHTFVVVSPDDPVIDSIVPQHGVTVLRCGGASRMESVRNGLAVLANTLRDTDWVLVHDAARPGLNAELIEKLIRAPASIRPADCWRCRWSTPSSAASPAMAAGTVPRNGLWLAQTPQMFRYQLLREALDGRDRPERDYR